MIAIAGATGQVGSRVVNRLANLGIPQRIMVRNVQQAPHLPNIEVAQISSYGDAKAVGKSLTGIDKLFMISADVLLGIHRKCAINKVPVPPYNRFQEHVAMVAAAAAVGVQHIVYLSFISAAPDSTFLLGHDHYHTEEYIRSTGLSFTFLRQCLYMDNTAAHASDDGEIRGPAGEGRVSWVARDDVADVAVAVLTGNGHEGQTYDVTGPEALTMAETAEKLSAVTGNKITYRMLSPHEVRLRRNAGRLEKWEAERRSLTGAGLSDEDVEVWISHYMQMATGEASMVSDTVPRLTGHPAISLTEYLNSYPECYSHLLSS
jgi:uncharacterized protein YbjT (DUF2867 family)